METVSMMYSCAETMAMPDGHHRTRTRNSSANKSLQSETSSIATATTVATKDYKKVHAELKHLQNNCGGTSTDPVVVNLEIIPKLLFEGMTSQKAATVEAAVENLADIFRLSREKRSEANEAGGHAVLVVTMKKWRTNELIQTSSCRCIQNMSCTNTEAKESFAVVGGLEAIVTAMRTFPRSPRIQRSGCGALMNLLSGTVNDEDDESMLLTKMTDKFVKEFSGISLVAAAMRKFPDEAKIQLWGNGLFQNIAHKSSYRRDMMKAGAVTAAGAALENHFNDDNIVQYASKFLRIMFR